MPDRIHDILTAAGLSKVEIDGVLKRNELIQEVATAHTDRQLAVRLACTVNATVDQLKGSFLTENRMKQADKAVSGLCQIDMDGPPPDFSAIQLDAAMIQAYQNAAPGSELNLSQVEIATFAALKKSKAPASEIQKAFQQVLLNRLKSYRAEGCEGILPYCRGRKKDFKPGDELLESHGQNKLLEAVCPELYTAMAEYPRGRDGDGFVESFFYTVASIDDKITVSLVHHLGVTSEDGDFFFAERQFYVSRSHNSVQGIGGAFAMADNPGKSVVAYCTRTSTDQVTGFGGSAKKAIGARIMGSKVAENLQQARNSFGS